jgi:hypothetical protein
MRRLWALTLPRGRLLIVALLIILIGLPAIADR